MLVSISVETKGGITLEYLLNSPLNLVLDIMESVFKINKDTQESIERELKKQKTRR